jgi:hypothetical protein
MSVKVISEWRSSLPPDNIDELPEAHPLTVLVRVLESMGVDTTRSITLTNTDGIPTTYVILED